MIQRYPGGREKLDEAIQGGELFQTIVYNPVSSVKASSCLYDEGEAQQSWVALWNAVVGQVHWLLVSDWEYYVNISHYSGGLQVKGF
jgi:hypothetical protein